MSVYHKDSPNELVQSIESMLNQTVQCEQFVLVEDGPIDRELSEIIDKYEEDYDGLFTIERMSENVGLGRALDAGIGKCRNELVARMDADDISLPERCEKLLLLFENNPNLAIAGTNIDEFYDDPNNPTLSRVVPSDYDAIRKYIRRRSPFNHPTVMFKKTEVIRCGGYGKMRRKQDFDLFSRMLNMGCYALNLDESLLLFRANENNYKRRKSWEYCRSYIEVERNNYKKGYCSLWDLTIVTTGQVMLHLLPLRFVKLLSDSFLRTKIKKQLR